MSLFAMMNKNSAVKVYRIDTDRQTDIKIKKIFDDQLSLFESRHNTELVFEAGYTPSYNECSYIDNFDEGKILLDAVQRSTAMPL